LLGTEFALNWLPTPRPAEDALWPSRLVLPEVEVGVLLRLFVELMLLAEEALCEVLELGWDTWTTLVFILVGVRIELLQEGPAVAAVAPGPVFDVRPVAEGDLALAVAVGDLERAGAVTGDLDLCVGAGDLALCAEGAGDFALVLEGGTLVRGLPGGDFTVVAGTGDRVNGTTGVETVEPKLERALRGSCLFGAEVRPL